MAKREQIITEIANIANLINEFADERLAKFIGRFGYRNFDCKHCVFSKDGKSCGGDNCLEGIKMWLRKDD